MQLLSLKSKLQTFQPNFQPVLTPSVSDTAAVVTLLASLAEAPL